MRELCRNRKEIKQRGCYYCADMVHRKMPGKKIASRLCPYDECPYHELDGFESYEQYMKQKGTFSVAHIKALMKNVTSCD